jgi:hypothetical protein
VGRIPHMLGEELNSLAKVVKLNKCSLDVRKILSKTHNYLTGCVGRGPQV